jgi:hypothetical protein
MNDQACLYSEKIKVIGSSVTKIEFRKSGTPRQIEMLCVLQGRDVVQKLSLKGSDNPFTF